MDTLDGIAIRPRLKSRSGCVTCKGRRKKCDEQRPQCRECIRLHLQCVWTPATNFIANRSLAAAPNTRSIDNQQFQQRSVGLLPRYKFPILPNLVPNTPECGQALQYLWERGQSITRHTGPMFVQSDDINVFKPGIIAATAHPHLLDAYLAVAARHLSFYHWQFEALGTQCYARSLQFVAERIQAGDISETVCVTAAIFSVYESLALSNAMARKAHLIGFHRLLSAKLRTSPDEWGPTSQVLEHYIYSLATSSTFYSRELLPGKGFHFVDKLIALRNRDRESFGPVILGIPTDLISAVYKLSFLRSRDTTEGLWSGKLRMLLEQLQAWQSDAQLFAISDAEMISLAQLYRLACIVLATKLINRRASVADPEILQHTKSAVELVKTLPSGKPPLTSLLWPLTFLSIGASNSHDREVLTRPIYRLVSECRLSGYEPVLNLIGISQGNAPGTSTSIGLDILYNHELCSEVQL